MGILLSIKLGAAIWKALGVIMVGSSSTGGFAADSVSSQFPAPLRMPETQRKDGARKAELERPPLPNQKWLKGELRKSPDNLTSDLEQTNVT